MNRIIIAIYFLLLSGKAISAAETTADVTITQISTYDSWAAIYISPGFANTQGCTTSQNKIMVRFQDGTSDKKIIYSAILAAYLAGKKVSFGLNGCFNDLPYVYRVDVK